MRGRHAEAMTTYSSHSAIPVFSSGWTVCCPAAWLVCAGVFASCTITIAASTEAALSIDGWDGRSPADRNVTTRLSRPSARRRVTYPSG